MGYRNEAWTNRTPLHPVWLSMRQRCYNKKNADYPSYGARGIKIHISWRDNFKAFYNWALKNGYRAGLEIDRRNNNSSYAPSNCRLVTRETQCRNTRIRKDNTSGFRGVGSQKGRFRAYINVSYKRIHLGYFDYPWTAGMVYDSYVLINNLEHTQNYRKD